MLAQFFLTIDQDDIELIFNNARIYNGVETAVHKAALRFQKAAEPLLAELASLDDGDIDYLKVLPHALDQETIDNLFNFDYDKDEPVVLPPPRTLTASTPKIPRKKRNSDLAGLGIADASAARASPRTRVKTAVPEIAKIVEVEPDSSMADVLGGEPELVIMGEAEVAVPTAATVKRLRAVINKRERIEKREGAKALKALAAKAVLEGEAISLVPVPSPEVVDVDNRGTFTMFETG